MKRSTRNMYDTVTQEIIHLISAGKLHHGNMLPPVSETAKNLGLSRRDVHEVYCHLSYIGMLEYRKGKGFFLTGDVTDSLRGYLRVLMMLHQLSPYDVCEMRRTMELAALPLAFERWEELKLEHLEKYLEQMQCSNLLDAIEADEKSHLWLMRASGNRLMECVMESVWEICAIQVNLILSDGEAELRDVQKKVHEKFYKGFLHRNLEQASEAVREHYATTKTALQKLEQRSPELFFRQHPM